MARIRTVKPEFFKHYDLFRLEMITGLPIRTSFSGLWCCADKEGRFKWSAIQLKLDVVPYDEVNFEEILNLFVEFDFIKKYETNGKLYGLIPTLKDHQKFSGSEAYNESKLPAPNDFLEVPKKFFGSSLEVLWNDHVTSKKKQRQTVSQSVNYILGSSKEVPNNLQGSYEEVQEGEGKEGEGKESKLTNGQKTEMTKDDFVLFQGKLIQDALFIEPLMSGKGIKEKADLLGWIKYFNVHIVTEYSLRKDYYEYRKHFRNWLIKWDTTKPPPLNGIAQIVMIPKLQDGDLDKYKKHKANV